MATGIAGSSESRIAPSTGTQTIVSESERRVFMRQSAGSQRCGDLRD